MDGICLYDFPRPMNWRGVFAATTTPFDPALGIDAAALAAHVDWMARAGCTGIVPLGSLGEGNTLDFDEKLRVIDIVREALAGRAALVPGIAALSTAEAVALVRAAERRGCTGAMILPPYVYKGDVRETGAYFAAVLGATSLPCMLYNNPIAYGTDVAPEQIAALAEGAGEGLERVLLEAPPRLARVCHDQLHRQLAELVGCRCGPLAADGQDRAEAPAHSGARSSHVRPPPWPARSTLRRPRCGDRGG